MVDFMFACGQYPAYEEFVELVKSEIEQAVVRLRHHPSLVIWGTCYVGSSLLGISIVANHSFAILLSW